MFRSVDLPKHVLGGLVVFGLFVWLSNVNVGGGPAPLAHRHNIKEVSAVDAKALVDGGAVIVDVRGREAFNSGHIPGAISAPLHEL